jgi:predicted MPP superfamily phosphohydrolase
MMLRHSIRNRVAVLLAAALLLAAIDALFVEPNRLVARRLSFPCPGLRRSPVRILLFSDVNFTAVGRRERRLREIAKEFEADLVLVAGDFLNSVRAARDAEIVRSGLDYLLSIPAEAGRFLVPGEEELFTLPALRRAWSADGLELLSNESRTLEIRGEKIDLLGANPPNDPAPWRIDRVDGMDCVASRGRAWNQALVYRGAGAEDWGDVEIELAFQALDPESFLDIRFAWREGPTRAETGGWRLIRHEYQPFFRLVAGFRGEHRLSGRTESRFLPPVGVWCRARIVLSDDGDATRIRAKLWPAWAPEPVRWAIDATDRGLGRRHRGTVALGSRSGERLYGALRVTDPGGRVLLDEPFSDPGRIGDPWSCPSALSEWAHRPAPDAARLVLVHHPDLMFDLADVGGRSVSLVLAGHTHGGQVRLPGLGAVYTGAKLGPRYDRGLFDDLSAPLYITPGVGTSVLPIRFLNPPEVTLLTLVPEQPDRMSELGAR